MYCNVVLCRYSSFIAAVGFPGLAADRWDPGHAGDLPGAGAPHLHHSHAVRAQRAVGWRQPGDFHAPAQTHPSLYTALFDSGHPPFVLLVPNRVPCKMHNLIPRMHCKTIHNRLISALFPMMHRSFSDQFFLHFIHDSPSYKCTKCKEVQTITVSISSWLEL